MKFLFLGDVVGKPGYTGLRRELPRIREEHGLDAVIANAENASDGSGLMPRQFRRLIETGVDAITMGDHLYRRKEIIEILETSDRLVKPANFPATAPGRTWTIIDTPAGRLAIISLLGRTYMRPVDCPFAAVDLALEEIGKQASHILVDIHAEATGDKQLIGRHLDGRVTAVLGTHTHVPTADSCILPQGTAFQCDVGMCGPYESILGRSISKVLGSSTTFVPDCFYVATQDVRLCGAIIEADETGKATKIERFELRLD